ncbi:MAG: metalloregulator ArsR/SmtB family transcription factor [Chloroflexi bacterium]|nr:metalloregulator ArsR/SmtB family transcription factor [Chloroflexota bacterium]
MNYHQTATLFKALAHPTRLHILDLLRGGEICVCHIERAIGKRQAYISQQLMCLREAKLVDSRREGLMVYYRIADGRVAMVLDTVLGEPVARRNEILDDCPCPRCAVVPVQDIT